MNFSKNKSSFLADASRFLSYGIPLSILFAYGLLLWKFPYDKTDFSAFYSAAKIIQTEPKNLYNEEVQKQYELKYIKMAETPKFHFFRFVNPIYFLLPYLPLTVLPPYLAFRIVQGGLGIIYIGLIYLLASTFFVSLNVKKWLYILCFAPPIISIVSAQSSLLSTLILLFIYVCLVKRHYVKAGVISSILFYKPHFLIPVLLFYLAMRMWKTLLATLLGVSVCIGAWILVSYSTFVSFIQFGLLYAGNVDSKFAESGYTVSLQGVIYQVYYFLRFPEPYVVGIIVSVVFLGFLYWFWSTHKNVTLLFSTVPLAILLGNGHVLTYEVTMLLIPYFIWYAYAPRLTRRFSIFGLVILSLLPFSPFSPLPFFFLPQIFMILILFFQLKYIDKEKRNIVPSPYLWDNKPSFLPR